MLAKEEFIARELRWASITVDCDFNTGSWSAYQDIGFDERESANCVDGFATAQEALAACLARVSDEFGARYDRMGFDARATARSHEGVGSHEPA